MNMIELHILQSFPTSCLNRDDVGAPKSAVFGGVSRARVSSQAWKRPIREMARELRPDLFGGTRGHFLAERIEQAVISRGVDAKQAREAAESIATFLGSKNEKYKDGHKTDVALYFSPSEIDALAEVVAQQLREAGQVNLKKGELKKAIKRLAPLDLADIAIFGRMVAADHTLMIEGAGLFSHALSTHRVSNEIDFFSAVDDMRHEQDEGAGHIGTLEFNAACYYRYIGMNLDRLADEEHLGHLSDDQRRTVLDVFLRSAILAVPKARKNSMFALNPPGYVLGLRRAGHPISLINAFESAIRPSGEGYLPRSRSALRDHFDQLKRAYNLAVEVESELPEADLESLIKALV